MLIGSRALAINVKSFKVREGSDWDIVGYRKEEKEQRHYFKIPENDRIEWHDPDHLNNRVLFNNIDNLYADLEQLYMIYRSHAWRNLKTDSVMYKLHKVIIPNLLKLPKHLRNQEFYIERLRLTKEIYHRGNPNLNQSNMDFFDDPVNKLYDHDYLHELYSYTGVPMYERLKHPDKTNLAWCEKDLWENLTYEERCKCVAEETYVIATERFMVPQDWGFPPRFAYLKSLNKVCTTLCSGWFRDFAIDNYDQIVKLFDFNKFQDVKSILENPQTNIIFHKKEVE